VQRDAPAGDPMVRRMEVILGTSWKASDLIRRVLAFGRRQSPRTEVINLARMLADLPGTARPLLGDEVRLDLVGRLKLQGKARVGTYVHRYAELNDWLFAAGLVQGRPAALAYDPANPDGPPSYFVLLRFDKGQLQDIRDFRYARYAGELPELMAMDVVPSWSAVAGQSRMRH